MPGNIKLTSDTISHQDIDSLCDWLKTYPQLTKGELTTKFESKFAYAVDANYAVFVNSGSSANLLMLSALKSAGKLRVGDAVGVPAICWSTDLAPIIQLGLVPVILDCNPDNLCVSNTHLQPIIKEHNIKCILYVSVLGIPGDIEETANICYNNGVLLLEDNCESLGSKYQENELGGFGVISSWSTYFSHHISTIEGGFITTNEEEIYRLLLMLRSHGWARDLGPTLLDEFTGKYTFFTSGYNVRNTEIGAFLGLRQIDKIGNIAQHRKDNFDYFISNIDKSILHESFVRLYNPKTYTDSFVSNFGLPLISRHRYKIIEALKKANIECRPLIAGNIARHPVGNRNVLLNRYNTKYADIVHHYGMYLPNHLDISKKEINTMLKVIESVL